MHPLWFSKAKLCTKFEVYSSSSFEDIFDWMSKILGVTWPRPRPFWVKLLVHLVGFPYTKLCTKFEVCIFLFQFANIYQCDKYEVSTFNLFCFAAIIMSSPVISLHENGHCAMRMRCVTWPVGRGPATTRNLETLTPICLFTIQLSGGYDDD